LTEEVAKPEEEAVVLLAYLGAQSAQVIQNRRKWSGGKPLKNAANPHGRFIGFRKPRNLG